MTLRRIHAKQCRAALGDLEQKQPTPDVAILEGLGAKCLLQRVELNQLQGQCAAQKLIAIKLDRMPVQGRVHLIDRAAMISGDLCHTLVDELVAVHDASLPLPARFAKHDQPAGLQGRTRDTELEGGPPRPLAKSSRPNFERAAQRRPRTRPLTPQGLDQASAAWRALSRLIVE